MTGLAQEKMLWKTAITTARKIEWAGDGMQERSNPAAGSKEAEQATGTKHASQD